MKTKAVARRARKQHRCDGCTTGYCTTIQPGEVYIVHTQLPGGDADYANAAGHPIRLNECRGCAKRYGRGHLITERETRP